MPSPAPTPETVAGSQAAFAAGLFSWQLYDGATNKAGVPVARRPNHGPSEICQILASNVSCHQPPELERVVQPTPVQIAQLCYFQRVTMARRIGRVHGKSHAAGKDSIV